MGARTSLAQQRYALLAARTGGPPPPPFCTQRASARSRYARTAHRTHARHPESRSAHALPHRPQPQDSTTRTHAALRAARTAPARPAPPPVAAPLAPRHHARTTTHDDEKMLSVHGRKAGDAGRWGTATLGGRPGNGVAALFLPCERGSHSHTVVVLSSQGPASASRFNYQKSPF